MAKEISMARIVVIKGKIRANQAGLAELKRQVAEAKHLRERAAEAEIAQIEAECQARVATAADQRIATAAAVEEAIALLERKLERYDLAGEALLAELAPHEWEKILAVELGAQRAAVRLGALLKKRDLKIPYDLDARPLDEAERGSVGWDLEDERKGAAA
jgi:hypothetical protein